MWLCTLLGANMQNVCECYLQTCVMKAVLGANAIKHEKNVVVVETVNYYKETVKQPIISLSSGNAESVSVGEESDFSDNSRSLLINQFKVITVKR